MFRILTPGSVRIAAGITIRYRLGWHGVPVSWTAEIRLWDPPSRFVGAQLSGPYQVWHHTHRFETHNGGTRISDIVRHRFRFGILGRAVHALKVRRHVERIFDYWFQRVGELFGGRKA